MYIHIYVYIVVLFLFCFVVGGGKIQHVAIKVIGCQMVQGYIPCMYDVMVFRNISTNL